MCFLDLVDGVLLIPHTFDAIRNFTSNPLRYLSKPSLDDGEGKSQGVVLIINK